MDKDSLRKQLYDEIHSQFDAKLKEARRQNSQLEEELELSEDKWRNERRRLNAEIDRLETAVTDAREARRKAPVAKTRESESQDNSRFHSAAEEKLKKAEQAWAAERASLRAEISRLQNGIADMIERSNNPLRTNQVEQDKLESRLQEAIKARRQAEDALIRAKEEWEQEKVSLVGDMMKNRRTSVPAKTTKPRQDDGRIEQLERQLEEAIRSRDKQIQEIGSAKEKLERELEKTRQGLAALKGDQSESATRLKSDLEEAHAELKLATRRIEDEKSASDTMKTNLEKQLRHAVSVKNGLERELEKVRQDLLRQSDSNTKNANVEAIGELRREYDERMQDMLRENARLSEELQNTIALLEEERNRADAGGNTDVVSAEVVEQLRHQYDERVQDMIRQKTELSDELRNATCLLEEERSRLSVNGVHNHAGTTVMDSHAIDAEVERIQDMIAGIARVIDDPETELSTVIRKNVERAELDAYLRGILFSLGRGQGL